MYYFESARLGFRNWKESDLPAIHRMNQDLQVMQYFPGIPTMAESQAFLEKMQAQFQQKKFCYFATEIKATQTFIGFIGLSRQDFEAEFTPCIDIGWRLLPAFWRNGYATEGAIANLQFGFEQLQLPEIVALAPEVNLPSIRVMKNAGMRFVEHFMHTKLDAHPHLQKCARYTAKRGIWAPKPV